ncbi:MAG: cytochrome c [Anaerolineaceae bacterium]|nr:cytochrome c [Anaerolineaceae bacterium]
MKKIFKWIGLVIGGLLLVALISAGGLILVANNRLEKTYNVPVEAITAASDPAGLARGQHIVTTVCVGCHGENLAGKPVINAPGFAVINAMNLTRGQGGVAADEYKTDADWVRAIRHGVKPAGQSLLLMPSEYFYYLSDADLADVIGYVKAAPPVDNEVTDPQLSPIAKMLVAAGQFDHLDVASVINQTGPRPVAPQPGDNKEYGQYLVTIHVCQSCHGPDLGGGKNPDPNGPHVPNLTPGGKLNNWTEADFVNTLRTGYPPNDKQLKEEMPWKIYGRMSDAELNAIWLYLKSLPAKR